MGLIQQARLVNTQPAAQADKKKSGLLDRVKAASAYDSILEKFRHLLKITGYERGGILFISPDGLPVFLFCNGFDLTTARRFAPDFRVLSGRMADESGWARFEGSSLEAFASCLSSREKDSLKAIEVHSVRLEGGVDAAIILADSLLDVNRTKNALSPFSAELGELVSSMDKHRQIMMILSRIASINQNDDALKERARSSLDSGKKATMVHISLSDIFGSPETLPVDEESLTLYSAIVHQIARQTGSANIVHAGTDYTVRVVLFTSAPVDTGLYFHQLLKPLEPLFGVQRISRIAVTAAGTATELREIIDFIYREV